jgi:hypothetical protein
MASGPPRGADDITEVLLLASFLAMIAFSLVALDALQGVDEEIYTYQLTQANPVDYLTQLQSQADRLAARPELWIPWSYCKALT